MFSLFVSKLKLYYGLLSTVSGSASGKKDEKKLDMKNKCNSKENNNNNKDYVSGFFPSPKAGKSNLFLKMISFLPRVLHRDKTRWAFENSREMYKIRGAFLERSQ